MQIGHLSNTSFAAPAKRLEGSSQTAALPRAEGSSAPEEVSTETGRGGTPASSNPQHLSAEDEKKVRELEKRDREVRAHEQAHLAAAASYARGGPSFDYQRGPDGRRYAVGGEVHIDSSPVSNDPEATLRKARTVRRAALAPDEPSPQDRRVAAEAARTAARAQRELGEQRRRETRERIDSSAGGASRDPAGTADSAALPAAAGRESGGRFDSTGSAQSGQLLDLFA